MQRDAAQPVREFTGPTGHYFRGLIRQMQRDPLGLYTKTQREYGDYVKLRVVRGIDCYLLTHPDAVEHILHKSHKNYRKPNLFYNSVGLLVGDGLFTNEGESWIRQRRLVQPAFHSQNLARLCPAIVTSTQAFVDEHKSKVNQPVDIAQAMMKLGLRIASTTLFSTDISGDADAVGNAFRQAFTHISNRMNSLQLIPSWLPTPANRRFRKAKSVLDHVVMDLIDARRKSTALPPDDFLSLLLNARDDQTDQPMPDRLLMDEVLTLLTAGHENIGAALAWTWYLLARHPDIQTELHGQINGLLKGRPPDFEDINQMPLLRAVFEESMRLYPPGWGELRESIGPDQINGYDIPARSLIILCQWVTHRHPGFWSDPAEFRPERFLASTHPPRHRFAYFPFGGGARICIGMQLAMLEASLVIATILQHFELSLADPRPVTPDATFTLRPREGVIVILKSRD